MAGTVTERSGAGAARSPRRQRARLVIPVWGRRYAERFLGLALPALLAPGILPPLRARLGRGPQGLSTPPRDLADLMLERLHYTVRAKTINRKMYRIERVDQLYHVVDNDTIVARQLPISIVAMKPERVLTDP